MLSLCVAVFYLLSWVKGVIVDSRAGSIHRRYIPAADIFHQYMRLENITSLDMDTDMGASWNTGIANCV